MSGTGARRVWIFLGNKSGDNAQVRTLAETLRRTAGWPYVAKQLEYRTWELALHVPSIPTLAGILPESRRQLVPPWPDLVVTAGRRNELAARWVASRAPGGTRLVHLGRPWSKPGLFDLVVTTPQYAVPSAGNVLINELPLTDGCTPAQTVDGAWSSRLQSLPRPWLVVLVGGNSGPYVFDRDTAVRLAAETGRLYGKLGGTLLVCSSPRTPGGFVDELRPRLEGAWMHDWRSAPADNPYRALLALGDAFIVTAESVSMTADAVATGKPLHLFDVLPPDAGRRWLRPRAYGWKPLSHRLAMALAPLRYRRDVRAFQQRLVSRGLACWLDGANACFQPQPWRDQDLSNTVARVLDLFGGR